ncbi:MAG TPA: hypothetical protein P5136_03785 [Methanofastidiosum sp.]|nr:hypothetical protein [Methanofastidiosum sp.]
MDIKKVMSILHYEISMFRDTYNVLKGLKKSTVEYNTYLESFLNHASCLYDFFYEKRMQDDIILKDLPVNKAIFKQEMTPKVEFENIEFKHKRNKQLAHITESRIELEASGKKTWPYGKIYILLNNTINAFVKSLPDKEKEVLAVSIE